MKIVTWNSRGIQHGPFRRECQELIKMNRPDVICFLETKTDSAIAAPKFLRRLGFDKDYQIPSQGRAGGLWLFWCSMVLKLEILCSSSQFIHCSLHQKEVSCSITFAYVQPDAAMKDLFWDEVSGIAQDIQSSWIVMGDFNDILSVEEASPKATRGFVRAQRSEIDSPTVDYIQLNHWAASILGCVSKMEEYC
ncbi:hypothetical protein SLA2020_091370 [Shorea laevis]